MVRRFENSLTSFGGMLHPFGRIGPIPVGPRRGPIGFSINIAVSFRVIG